MPSAEGKLGAVIVPAHNEEAVIARTLAPLSALATSGRIELVVAANGCTDATVQRARSVPGTTVLDLPTPSKTAALNAADAHATTWPRIYLDADIEITAAAVEAVLTALSTGPALAARPPYRFDVRGASRLVRSFYRARERLPECEQHLWGAGVYALSRSGHDRFGAFPALVADDLFVDAQFAPHEVEIVPCPPVLVRTPRDVASLLAVLRRTYAGNAEHVSDASATGGTAAEATTARTARQLVVSALQPVADSAVYAGMVTASRISSARRNGGSWERDDSSRERDLEP
ncbi:glycosyltransferase [Nocardioides sp. YIM 152588]|uniref:glycosyltransferase n=1 Tax=Nocardioides sp. YIM 152588 TaxID=3158259 RepID=UPI0032E37BCB